MFLQLILKISVAYFYCVGVSGLTNITSQYYLENRELTAIKVKTLEQSEIIIEAPFMRVELEQGLCYNSPESESY